MCQARFDNGAFDPAFCPLLAGLSPEEIAERLANDPMIRRCADIETTPEPCAASVQAVPAAIAPKRLAKRAADRLAAE